jgi:sec-independent protein translocase protein TatA
MPNIGPVQLIIILVIVLLVFGTKRIRNLGSDLGGAIREFRKGVSDDSDKDDKASTDSEPSSPATKND